MEDIPLFDVPPAQRRWAPKQHTRFIGANQVVWTKYRPQKPHKCDDCKLFLAQNDGKGPASLDGKWRRKTANSDRYLCVQHAQIWRTRDKLPTLEG
ncbi:MAG: hypothetical protein JWO98_2561 [Frankiales bacterium]|nr:hypothetical protein [Frankiales bacterium]